MSTTTANVMVVLGTRPEAIKLAPVINALRAETRLQSTVVHTGQHRELAADVLTAFGIEPDVRLDLLRQGQSLPDLFARAVIEIAARLERQRPAVVVVQGDTTTAAAAAIAAAQARIPVAHVEAGLRSGDRTAPFPEEDNRRLISVVTDIHLASTALAKANLIAEGIKPETITVTGNTGIDALEQILVRPHPIGAIAAEVRAHRAHRGPVALVTTHRRESWGPAMANTARGVRQLLDRAADLLVVLPMHPNPQVRADLRAVLGDHPRALLCEPLPYADMAHALAASSIVLTDSGGLQEEAPHLGIPVLVLRDTTERPEGVLAGASHLIGTHPDLIVGLGLEVIYNPDVRATMAQPRALYGDGHASRRTVATIARLLGHDTGPVDEFTPAQIGEPLRSAS